MRGVGVRAHRQLVLPAELLRLRPEALLGGGRDDGVLPAWAVMERAGRLSAIRASAAAGFSSVGAGSVRKKLSSRASDSTVRTGGVRTKGLFSALSPHIRCRKVAALSGDRVFCVRAATAGGMP